ncbi:MAG: hypothetical protein ACLT2T_06935 [Bilophila wadsworthia]
MDEIPFDFTRRRMSVVVADKAGKTQIITKGAVEEVLHLQLRGIQGECGAAHQRVERGDPRHGAAVQRGRAARHRRGPQDESDGRRSVFRGGRVGSMVLIGYLAFLDPPGRIPRRLPLPR